MSDINMKAYDKLKAVGLLAGALFDSDDLLQWMLVLLENNIRNDETMGVLRESAVAQIVEKRKQLSALKAAVKEWENA